MTKKEKKRKHGQLRDIIGGGWLRLKPGEWTDDTEMTLAVAEGILVNPHEPVPPIGDKFLEWFKTNPPDVGNTINAAFRSFLKLNNWCKAAEALHNKGMRTAGNGALMRTLPIALFYRDPVDIYIMSMSVARMTHWDPEAGLTCFLYCLLAREFINGNDDKLDAWKKTVFNCLHTVPLMMRGFARRIIHRDLGYVESWYENELKPSGYTVDSLACALWCFFNSESFEESVVKAVNLGGDADTIGAITGGLAGVYWGYDSIPGRWLAKFSTDQRNRLDRVATSFEKVVMFQSGSKLQ